jgi:hypothetical protein
MPSSRLTARASSRNRLSADSPPWRSNGNIGSIGGAVALQRNPEIPKAGCNASSKRSAGVKRMVDLMVEIQEGRAMPTGKHKAIVPPAKPHRGVRLSDKELKVISENQRLAGFSGRIMKTTATHEVDMDAIADSAKRFNAQIPSPAPLRSRVRNPLLMQLEPDDDPAPQPPASGT